MSVNHLTTTRFRTSTAKIWPVMSTEVFQLRVSAQLLPDRLSFTNGITLTELKELRIPMTRLPPGKRFSHLYKISFLLKCWHSHKGPIITYLAKVADAATAKDVNSLGWFKIAQDGLSGGVWAVDKLYSAKNGKWSVCYSSATGLVGLRAC